jgi:multicomponent Na+:H+ antiporter subunit D
VRALILPVLVPFLTTVTLALVNGRHTLEKGIALASTLGLTAFVYGLLAYVDRHGVQAMVVGGWAAPFGIAFVADRLTCIMLCLSMTIASVALIYTLGTVDERQQRYFFYPLFTVTLLGVNWCFITGDLFNLFVGYEVMLIGSYGLMMVGASRAQVRETFRYVVLNGIGSTLFVVGCGLVYATVGTLNMADLAGRTAALGGQQAALVSAVSLVLLVVFALKSATFPLFFWLPGSYPVVPAGVNGYFAGLLTKVGVYSLLRMFVMVFRQDGQALAIDTLLGLAGITMLLGVLGAMCQWDISQVLAWHSVSQVGYMIMGIGLANDPAMAELAIVGTILFVVHHGIVKSSLFLIGGIAERAVGTQDLKRLGGLVELAPAAAGLFLVAGLSLAGVPPFSGFLGKLVLVRAGLGAGAYLTVFAALATGFLTLYSMVKVWRWAFWGAPCRTAPAVAHGALAAPTLVLVVLTAALGMGAAPFLRLAHDAARELRDPRAYTAAVLQPGRDLAAATRR